MLTKPAVAAPPRTVPPGGGPPAGYYGYEGPPRHFEGTSAALRLKYGSKGSFSIVTRFLQLGSGIDPRVPYILKGEYAGRYNSQRKAIRAGARISSATRLARRKDRDAGQPITYPALVINQVH